MQSKMQKCLSKRCLCAGEILDAVVFHVARYMMPLIVLQLKDIGSNILSWSSSCRTNSQAGWLPCSFTYMTKCILWLVGFLMTFFNLLGSSNKKVHSHNKKKTFTTNLYHTQWPIGFQITAIILLPACHKFPNFGY